MNKNSPEPPFYNFFWGGRAETTFGRSNLEPGGGERSKVGSGKHRRSGLVMHFMLCSDLDLLHVDTSSTKATGIQQ